MQPGINNNQRAGLSFFCILGVQVGVVVLGESNSTINEQGGYLFVSKDIKIQGLK